MEVTDWTYIGYQEFILDSGASFKKILTQGEFNSPNSEKLSRRIIATPYVIPAGGAYPLSLNLMKRVQNITSSI